MCMFGRRRRASFRSAFTLVELLVVIGIIALLISILLPTLGKARESANTVACLSNVRQLGMAALMFSQDHKGYLPTSSDDKWAKMNDPRYEKFAYRHEPANPQGQVVKDWASSLIRYLGGRDTDTFQTAPEQSRVFRCPSDRWLDIGPESGYRIFNNVTGQPNNPQGFYPISYGINADITCLVDNTGYGRFGLSDA